MDSSYIVKTLPIDGMTCSGCEFKIEGSLKKLDGVVEVVAKYGEGSVQIKYNPNHTEFVEIIEAIENLGYSTIPSDKTGQSMKANENDRSLSVITLIGIGTIIFAIYWLIENTIGFNFLPEVEQNMSLFMLFVVGLLTSIHCISMCGGINLSQSIGYRDNLKSQSRFDTMKPSLLYNAGRVTSYTIIGGVVGAIGSIFSLSGVASGFVSIVAGAFMILMGFNMLNIFPSLRKFTPRMPKFIAVRVNKGKTNKGPFIVGVANGFMPCGPLQTMQIYALGTGSAITGALSMFFFSIGTVPLMFAFGAISTLLSSNFTKNMMQVSAVLVMILGVGMLNRGFSLSGIDPFGSVSNAFSNSLGIAQSADVNEIEIRDGIQFVNSTFTGRRYEPITVQVGIPVVWTIDVQAVNGCNNPIVINDLGLRIDLTVGENIVEFTPSQTGIIPYSCWMGMIRSRIIVVDDLDNMTQEEMLLNESEEDEYTWIDEFLYNFFNQQFTVSDIQVATIVEDVQEVTITRQFGILAPNTIVMQENIDFIIRFEVLDELNQDDPSDNWIIFPEYGGMVDLKDMPETPPLPAIFDFAFGDILGNTVFVKLVPDINNFNEEDIVRGAAEYFENLGFVN